MADTVPRDDTRDGDHGVGVRVATAGGEPYVAIDTGTRAAPDNRPLGVDAETARALAAELEAAADAVESATSPP